jgi:hypothetical protein
VFGYFEQIENTEESRFAGELWRNVREAYRLDRVDFDLAFIHAVTPARFHAWRLPNAHAARDLAAPDAVAEPLGKHHAVSLADRLSR